VASRTALFKTATDREDDNEKLVELFKNRAELKKEFAELRKEQYRLQQRIKEEQGGAARITQKLEHLERLLVDPDWVHTVVVFYQLRHMNRKCTSKLAKFAEQLKQQRERRQLDGETAAWKKERRSAAAAIKKQIGAHRVAVKEIEDRLRAEHSRVESMSGFEKVLKSKSVSGEIGNIEAELVAAQQAEQELLEELKSIKERKRPDTAGLGIADKRSINFMILSFAQQLYLQFRDPQLVSMIKEAADKSVGAINYGDKADCDALLELALKNVDAIDSVTDFADVLQQRAGLIAEHAMFENDDDAVPVAGTVSTLFAIDANGAVQQKDANLLGDNYWGLREALSR
jgi:hypothetical protein